MRDKIINAHRRRINKIIEGEYILESLKMADSPKIILDLFPVIKFEREDNFKYDLTKITKNIFPPIYGYDVKSMDLKIENPPDRFISYSKPFGEKCLTYSVIFKCGVIESVEATMIKHHREKIEYELKKVIPYYLLVYKLLDIPPPFRIRMVFTKFKGDNIPDDCVVNGNRGKNIFSFPEINIDNYEINADTDLEPWFEIDYLTDYD